MHIIHAQIFTISPGSSRAPRCWKEHRSDLWPFVQVGSRRRRRKKTRERQAYLAWLGFPLGFWALVGEDERKRGKEGAYVSALRSIRWFSLAHACLPCSEEKTEREWQGTLARCIQLLPFSFSAKVFSLPPLKENEVYPPSLPLSSPLLRFGSLPPPLLPPPGSTTSKCRQSSRNHRGGFCTLVRGRRRRVALRKQDFYQECWGERKPEQREKGGISVRNLTSAGSVGLQRRAWVGVYGRRRDTAGGQDFSSGRLIEGRESGVAGSRDFSLRSMKRKEGT